MRPIKQLTALLLALCLVLTAMPTAAFAADDTATVTVNVTYKQTEARSMLELVNDFRTGDDAWAWDSTDSEQVYYTGLSELAYDYALEEAAMQRAAEVALSYSHTRPNGTSCFTAYSWSSAGENIAAGTALNTAAKAFALWQETDESYSGQGHRRNMLSSSVTAVAVACVYYNGCYYWVQEFRKPASSQAATTANDSATDVDVEIALSDATVTVTASASSLSLTVGEMASLPTLTTKLQMSGAWPSRSGPVTAEATWTVGDESCATLSDGVVTAVAAGSTTLTATVLGETVSVPVTVEEAACVHVTEIQNARDATCTEDGYTGDEVCTLCGETVTVGETIPATGHSYAAAVTEPTCTTGGYTTYTCSVCGDSYVGDETDATGHSYTYTSNGDGTHTVSCAQGDLTAYSESCTYEDGVCAYCGASEPETSTVVASGDCGDGLTWTLDEDGVLTISGTGDMTDWSSYSSVPWYDYQDSITSVTIENGVTTIGDSAFCFCERLTSVTIPNSVISIGNYAFCYCTSLTSVTIPDSVTSIEEYTFSDCASLTSVTIPDSVTSIGDSAFYRCTSLSSVTIPDSVISIDYSAFEDCTSLTSVTIPDSVTSIGGSAFYNCSSLTSVTIPDSVTSVGDYSFAYCRSLVSVTIPDSVTSIGENVFYDCSGLAEVSLGSSVESIGYCAFHGCTGLTSVTIQKGVTSIGSSAFYGCTSLRTITIPDSVITIGHGAFGLCTRLTDVYYAGSDTDWAAISIENGNGDLTNATIHYNSIGPFIAPTITSLYNSTSGVSVGWDAVDGATSYIVWRLNNSSGKWEKCATTTGTTYLSTSPVSGTTYYYAIEAVNGDVTSGRGTQRYILYMATPKVSLENTTSGIKVSWNSVTGATSGYQVYRRTADTDYELLKQVSTSTTSYTDTTAEAGVRYYYIVRSVRGSARSAYASQYITRLTTPTGISVSNTKSGVQVTWSAVTGATSYQVWRKLSGSSSWSKVGTTTGTSYTSTGVTSGKTYVFTVKAVYNSSVSAYNTTGKTIMRLAEPTITLENLVGGLTASWNAVDGAEGYKLYRRSETGSYVLAATLDADELSYTDKAAAAGVVYYYRVQAYNGSYTSSWTSQFNRRIGHTTLSLAKDEDGVVLTWTKSGGCTGYYIYRMNEDGSYTRIKTITSADTLTWTDTDVDLASGNAYTYIVRGYNGSSLGSYTPKKTSDFF